MSGIPILDIDAIKRRMITPQNLTELGITPDSVEKTLQTVDQLMINGVRPDGISINETNFGTFSGPTAAERGWIAYYNVGAPLVEERSSIVAPVADMLSARAYENRSGTPQRFEDTVEFTISNTFHWSLAATAQFTISGSVLGEESYQYQEALQSSLAKMLSQTVTLHNHKDNIGTQTDSQAQATVTDTTTETTTSAVRGQGTLSAELMLALTGSISGDLTTSWTSRSSVSGEVPSNGRIETMVTQRRQVVQHIYELPINFGGFVALHYPEEVYVQNTPPQAAQPPKSQVIAQKMLSMGLVDRDLQYRPKGIAETISRLNVDHTIFGGESAPNKNQGYEQPRQHYL
jgi:hypothetical protein